MKLALSALALALCVPAASATAEVRFGLLGGISLATLTFDPEPEDFELERITGPAAGAALEFGVNDNFAIEARGLWVRKGAKLTSPGFGDVEFRILIDYVSVPVLFKLRGGGAIRPYIAVGPEVGFKLNAKTRLTLGAEEEEEDVSDDVKSTDFGLASAAGLEFAAGRLGVFVEAGYSLGLTSIDENPLADAIDAQNGAWLFLAGIRF